MGMYDTFVIDTPCPRCRRGRLGDAQSKRFSCELERFEPGDRVFWAPDRGWMPESRVLLYNPLFYDEALTGCNQCDASFDVLLRFREGVYDGLERIVRGEWVARFDPGRAGRAETIRAYYYARRFPTDRERALLERRYDLVIERVVGYEPLFWLDCPFDQSHPPLRAQLSHWGVSVVVAESPPPAIVDAYQRHGYQVVPLATALEEADHGEAT